MSINIHKSKKDSNFYTWLKDLFTPEYQIVTRGVDGITCDILYVTGRKNLKIILKQIESSMYTNVVSIFKIKRIKDVTTKKKNWFI